VSPDGRRLYITGSIEISTSDTDYLTIACDADTGARLWARRYDGSANSFDFATAMASSPDGSRIVVTGYSLGVGTSDDYATIAYDAGDGATLWDVRYDGPGHDSDQAESLAINPDGGSVVVTGHSVGAQSGVDFGTAVYDMATGSLVWARRYTTVGVNDDIARSVVTSPDGATLYVTGSTGSDHPDLTTLAYAGATGDLEWASVYDGTGHGTDVPQSMVVSVDGLELFVAGSSEGSGELGDAIVVAYEA
jgi:TolB-like protein